MVIRVLPPHVAALIAAGEVIDRPASVVRELIDNALDAGAKKIDIEIQGRGFSRIIVSDDGCGMVPDDLSVALLNHATSKLPDNDIYSIKTLGFRGEALPSIAAMANVTVISRPQEQDVAFMVRSEDEVHSKVRPYAGGFGTRIEVEGLYNAHPARRAFLKSFNVEYAHILSAVDAAALANAGVQFILRSGKDTTNYRLQSDIGARIRDVRGEPLSKDGIPVGWEASDIKVSGLISMPSVVDIAGNGQIDIIINGRLITDRALSAVVANVYKTLTGKAHRPYATLLVELDPGLVNMNVHPAKREVRFREGVDVAAAVRMAVETALDASGLRSPSALANMARQMAKASDVTMDDPLRLPLGRYRGQLHNAWLIAETVDGLALVDQHAAHERIILERLKKAAAGFPEEIAKSPTPLVRDVLPEEAAAVRDAEATLSAMGFGVTCSPRTIALTAYPSVLADQAADALLSLIIDHCVMGTTNGLMGDALWERLATAACKAAIKAGHSISDERGARLLREIEATPNAAICNHGRPTITFLTNEQIAKLFDRS